MTNMQQYDKVKVIAIRDDRFNGKEIFYKRAPMVGDIGCIVEIYEGLETAFEVECSDSKDGSTIWLDAMFPDELAKA